MWLPPIERYHQAVERLPSPSTQQRAPLESVQTAMARLPSPSTQQRASLEHVQIALARLRDDDLEMPRTRPTGGTHAIFDL
jgi:hypothetical protein